MPLPVNVTQVAQAPAPIRDDVLSLLAPRKLSLTWIQWITGVYLSLRSVVRNVGGANVDGAAASIAPTTLVVPNFTQGLYQVSYLVRITQAAGTSSSISVTVTWVDHGVTCTQTSVPLTDNTISTQQSGFVLIQADEGSAVQYSTTYASAGVPPMQYQVYVRLGVAP